MNEALGIRDRYCGGRKVRNKATPGGGAPGPDEMQLELVNNHEVNRREVLRIMNRWWRAPYLEEEELRGRVMLFSKKEDTRDLGN